MDSQAVVLVLLVLFFVFALSNKSKETMYGSSAYAVTLSKLVRCKNLNRWKIAYYIKKTSGDTWTKYTADVKRWITVDGVGKYVPLSLYYGDSTARFWSKENHPAQNYKYGYYWNNPVSSSSCGY